VNLSQKIYANGSEKNGCDLALTEKFVVPVLGDLNLKASPNVCRRAKHSHWAKKVVRQQQLENADKIPIQSAQDKLSMWPQGTKNEFTELV
jgi:hypothetical protein